jgi:hypothetical protein
MTARRRRAVAETAVDRWFGELAMGGGCAVARGAQGAGQGVVVVGLVSVGSAWLAQFVGAAWGKVVPGAGARRWRR